ncbi:hypothetical protein CEXT_69531 [Caerostris extrusa]|uniref:Uncharacterized protein n=1 Tax=Caerostris extrusa TaxID=172846 RepID=A0AAV4TEF3_CAEEX|nr:hypothetical protein CEXT_69531 [Caerostris extrusa]
MPIQQLLNDRTDTIVTIQAENKLQSANGSRYITPSSQAREIRRSSELFTIRSSVIGLAGPPRWNSLSKSSGRDLLSLGRFDRRESTRSELHQVSFYPFPNTL